MVTLAVDTARRIPISSAAAFPSAAPDGPTPQGIAQVTKKGGSEATPLAMRAARGPSPLRLSRRTLAILPQLPAFSSSFLRKEKRLRAQAERAVMDQQRLRQEAVKTPQFTYLTRPGADRGPRPGRQQAKPGALIGAARFFRISTDL